MWPAIGAIGGAVVGGLLSNKGAAEANAANAAMSWQQMNFQERMSNTAHQREILDLQKAGLNPMLSVRYGQGASSPPGAMATMQNEYGGAVTAAKEMALLMSEIKLKEAQAKDAEASAKVKAFPASVSETASDAVTKIKEGARPVADAVMDAVLPRVEGAASAIGAGRDRAVAAAVEAAEAIRDLPARVREKVETGIVHSASKAKAIAEDLKRNTASGVGVKYRDIAPSLKRELRGKMRGKLGGASRSFGLGDGPY